MSALTTREESHARLTAMFKNALERILPLDRTRNMRGANFFDWKKLVDEHMRPVLAAGSRNALRMIIRRIWIPSAWDAVHSACRRRFTCARRKRATRFCRSMGRW